MPGRAAFIVALLLLCPGSGEEVSVSSRKYDYSTATCIKTKAEAEQKVRSDAECTVKEEAEQKARDKAKHKTREGVE